MSEILRWKLIYSSEADLKVFGIEVSHIVQCGTMESWLSIPIGFLGEVNDFKEAKQQKCVSLIGAVLWNQYILPPQSFENCFAVKQKFIAA